MGGTQTDMNPVEIRFLLNRLGMTFADVDRKHGLISGTARKAARYPLADGETALALTLSMSPRALWPSRYTPDGVRLKPQPTSNYIDYPRLHASQKGNEE